MLDLPDIEGRLLRINSGLGFGIERIVQPDCLVNELGVILRVRSLHSIIARSTEAVGRHHGTDVWVVIEQAYLGAVMIELFTRVQDGFRPELLNLEAIQLPLQIFVDGAVARVPALLLWFNLGIVDLERHLDTL